jgi:hypothetical protein
VIAPRLRELAAAAASPAAKRIKTAPKKAAAKSSRRAPKKKPKVPGANKVNRRTLGRICGNNRPGEQNVAELLPEQQVGGRCAAERGRGGSNRFAFRIDGKDDARIRSLAVPEASMPAWPAAIATGS